MRNSLREQTSYDNPGSESPKFRVLAVDDSADGLYVQKTVLELEGFEVFTAQSGGEGLRLLSEIEQPDLILLDMQLGDMTGTEFLTQLEKDRPDFLNKVPVVFLTGMDKIPNSRAVGMIRKPPDLNQFIKDVYRFIKLGPSRLKCQ